MLNKLWTIIHNSRFKEEPVQLCYDCLTYDLHMFFEETGKYECMGCRFTTILNVKK